MESVPVPLCLVDAFVDGPFSGNPAGVCLLPAEPPEAWMQAVAQEMAQAETAFCWPQGEAWGLRWFTPAVEVDLCGHATLATAHVLWQRGLVPADAVCRFVTKSGELTCSMTEAGIEMDFPAVYASGVAPPEGLDNLLGQKSVGVWASAFDWIVELPSEDSVRSLKPDFAALEKLGKRGLAVTSAGKDVDFVSRFFAPQSGVPEDQVTGSAHCTLGPLWAERLGKQALSARQLSPRGGAVGVRIVADRVLLSGRAKVFLTGESLVDP